MTNKEILEKAIQKAIEGGWKWPYSKDYFPIDYTYGPGPLVLWNHSEDSPETINSEAITFNHNFAKALWGEALFEDQPEPWEMRASQSLWRGGPEYFLFEGRMWQFHLQQMVIADDPIKYLGENI